MAATETTERPNGDAAELRAEWLDRLSGLASLVGGWAEESRLVNAPDREDDEGFTTGKLQAPALMMQKGTTRVLLDPITRFAPGADGVVDLYLMPAYDDIASLYFVDGEWRLQYVPPDILDVETIEEAKSSLLSREALTKILDEMSEHATSSL